MNIFKFLKQEKGPAIPEKTEVKKCQDEDSGHFYYIKSDHFRSKKDKNGFTLQCYYTCRIDATVSYEEAISNSIAFKFNAQVDKIFMEKESISKTHYNFGQKDNVHTGMMQWKLSDNSQITEMVSFTIKR